MAFVHRRPSWFNGSGKLLALPSQHPVCDMPSMSTNFLASLGYSESRCIWRCCQADPNMFSPRAAKVRLIALQNTPFVSPQYQPFSISGNSEGIWVSLLLEQVLHLTTCSSLLCLYSLGGIPIILQNTLFDIPKRVGIQNTVSIVINLIREAFLLLFLYRHYETKSNDSAVICRKVLNYV